MVEQAERLGPLREITDAFTHGTDVLSVDRSGLAVATVMAENEAPISSGQPDPFPFLDRAGYASYSHVDLLGIRFNVDQQIGIPVLLAAVAALVGEDEVLSEGVVKLASNDRCADQSAREREANGAEGRRSRSCSRKRTSGSPISNPGS